MLNNQHAAATMKIAIDFAQKRYCRTGQAEDIAMAGIEYIIRYNKTSTMPSRWYIYRNVIKAGQDAGYKKKAEQHDPIYTAILKYTTSWNRIAKQTLIFARPCCTRI